MVTVHPECIGRGHRMAMLEQFIAEAPVALDGVVFERLDAYLEPARAAAQASCQLALARARTASNIGAVSRPVKVFCWLGW